MKEKLLTKLTSALLIPMLGIAAFSGMKDVTTTKAATTSIHGVNWADARDNFQTGWVMPSSLTTSDTYATAQTKASYVIASFKEIGANTVRLPINPNTVLESWWSTYKGAIDKSLSMGMKVILCCWEGQRDGYVDNLDQFWNMWNKVVSDYGSNSNVYFEVLNEPYGYSASDLINLYKTFLSKYSSVPDGRIILDGTGLATDVTAIGADQTLSGCLLGCHTYWWFFSANESETYWYDHLGTQVGKYASRTVVTEYGGEMTTGNNYAVSAADSTIAHIRGTSAKLHDTGMGSVYWPGWRDGDTYSMMSGAYNSLSVTNLSGLGRVQYGWGVSLPSSNTSAWYTIQNVNSGKVLDVTNSSKDGGVQITQYTSTGGYNQQWQFTSVGNGYYTIKNRNSGLLMDIDGASTSTGAANIQWSSNGGNNQKWQLLLFGSSYKIMNVNSGLILDISGGSTSNGGKSIQWSNNGGNNQLWKFNKQ